MMTTVPRPLKVLITEDDPYVSKMIARLLAGAGFAPAEAPDARSAFEALRRPTDVMILDMHLPDRTGLEVLDFVRRESPGLPVIMVTGEGTIPCAVEAVKAGAFDYLTKPFRAAELIQATRRAVSDRLDRSVAVACPLTPPQSTAATAPVRLLGRQRKGSYSHMCPTCHVEPLVPSRLRLCERPLLLTPLRPRRCQLCYGRFWRLCWGHAARGSMAS